MQANRSAAHTLYAVFINTFNVTAVFQDRSRESAYLDEAARVVYTKLASIVHHI